MAGASAVHLYLTNGQTLHVYVASTAAVGTNAPVSDQAAATSASNTDFTVSSDTCVRDQINDGTAATAGEMEVYKGDELRLFTVECLQGSADGSFDFTDNCVVCGECK